jgi:hypothetical protein
LKTVSQHFSGRNKKNHEYFSKWRWFPSQNSNRELPNMKFVFVS